MADFHPFRGLRYDSEKVDLAQVLAPPYDVIKGAMRDQLISQSPYNIVQVELAAPYGEDATPQQYERSADFLRQWQADGVLTRDADAFYLYEQEFEVPGTTQTRKRRGVLGALKLEEFGDGVKPHEHTLSGPKADRLNLLRALETNTSPIFGLYDDPSGAVAQVLQTVSTQPPVAQATDTENVTHRLWKIDAPADIETIRGALQSQPIFIADGHHRYETALNYLKERKAAAEKEGRAWTGNESENAVMMMCVSTTDDGLVVLPTHRLVKNVDAAQIAALPAELADHFLIEKLENADDLSTQLVSQLDENSALPVLGMHTPQGTFVLKLREGETHREAMDAERSAAYNALDVTILHRLILEKSLGIDAEKLAAGGHVSYTIDAAEAMKKVNDGEYSAAFFLRSTPVSQVQDVAAAGDKMPQKSTYFYPKLITGLVLRPLD